MTTVRQTFLQSQLHEFLGTDKASGIIDVLDDEEYTVKNLSDTVCLSNDDVEKITTKLMDREAEKTQLREHINEIHEVKVDKQQKLTSGICPKCGSELILRNGKYGKFYGCSGYPKCRFTAPVD